MRISTVNKITTRINAGLGLTSLVAGASHGFCDAQGIEIEPRLLELALTYGPAAATGATNGVISTALSLPSRSYKYLQGNPKSQELLRKWGDGVGAAIGLGAINASLNAMISGLYTLVGYAGGYAAGRILK